MPHGLVTFNQDVTDIVGSNLLCVFFSWILLGKGNVNGCVFFLCFFLTLHFYFADSQADGVMMEWVDNCSFSTQCRMAAGNKCRHAQRSLPRVKQISLRFTSGV